MTKSITRRSAIQALGAFGAMAIAGAAAGCDAPSEPDIKPNISGITKDDRPSVLNGMSPNPTFAADIASVLLPSIDKSSCLSPASLSVALTMLAVGTKGATQKELLRALNSTDIKTLTKSCRQMIEEVSVEPSPEDKDGGAQIFFANSIWADDDYKIQTLYAKQLEEEFDAEINTCDFAKSKTNKKISKWVSEKTNGLLKPKFRFEKDTVMALVNTLYFRDCWRNPFDESLTEQADFNTATGTEQADFMHASITGAFAEYAEGQIGELQFGNSGARLRFVLPWEDGDVASLLNDPAMIDALLSAELDECLINWSLPKFTIKNTFDLVDSLKELGLKETLKPSKDFENALVRKKGKRSELCVSSVEQGTRIEINENGALAAAYTAIAEKATGLIRQPEYEVDFTLDRPFAYALIAWDGAPLFIGTMQSTK